ncbi:GNAT family N-acetyltransferase [Photobacterium sp. WH77]|nr:MULTISPECIES: GNAT family N-acetyltransferase [Photobacterium]MBV7264424.1 GNAT family N-acetyltransferase [Photobacterium sp. WH24]MCG2837473.1 GNAT family N-acetyltransferase [Photobacterium sp. WH77]MCG2844957.1 GNAT family N-acetyltransferase [Photobacterium sp. WH80]MDO6582290.1 GNAT family N-acetyltransferase [Photobacterium sp. 2_MG-2023]
MAIRVMTADDAEEVEALVKSAFLASAAKQLAPAGIHTFFKVASKEALLLRLQEDNLILVYEQQGKIIGMAELKQGAHLAMLFVLPDWQGKGIATQLLQVLLQQVRHAELTVRASLNSVSFYQAQGFQKTGAAAELAGLRYQPMSLTMTSTVTAPADPSASVL